MNEITESLDEWKAPKPMLEHIFVISSQRGLKHFADYKDLREAWVLSNFCKSFFKNTPIKLRLVNPETEFPDGYISVDGGEHKEGYEITDAFEGGTGHPDKISELFEKLSDKPLEGTGWRSDDLIRVFKKTIDLSISRKKQKNYSECHNLLIYLRDVSECHLKFEDLAAMVARDLEGCNLPFKSINILSSDGQKSAKLFSNTQNLKECA